MISRRVSGEYCGEKAAASQARRASQLLYHREHRGTQGKPDSPCVPLCSLCSSVVIGLKSEGSGREPRDNVIHPGSLKHAVRAYSIRSGGGLILAPRKFI